MRAISYAGIPVRIFNLFSSCDLDLDSMTFIYEFDTYSMQIYRMCKMNFLRQVFLNLSYYSLYRVVISNVTKDGGHNCLILASQISSTFSNITCTVPLQLYRPNVVLSGP